ncbi:hypothetical protein LSCM4_06916 [Leishmania orientalis]|uniref:MutL C-terminal dimerisation domain-containing protein n=1 Tax=Leishmania orientalis TaxID=2249476 RepID=A0A836HRY8_9TRYP|nr:hypothetical protein LSCM4_06916 [Leishmania orientalis]
MHQEHIQRLGADDAAVLRASDEFSTFTDAFARVAQVGLPQLEAEVGKTFFSDSVDDASHDVAVSLCLPALSWDITRTCVLPITDELRRKTEMAVRGDVVPPGGGGAPPGTEKQDHTEERPDGLELLGRLASICTDVSVGVWLETVESAETQGDASPTEALASRGEAVDGGKGGGLAARLSHESPSCLFVRPLVPETRWHCGQQIPLGDKHTRRHRHAAYRPLSLEGVGGASPHSRFQDVSDSERKRRHLVRLITVCRVRGLFYNLPVRQAPFVGLLGSCSYGALTGSSGTSAAAYKTLSERDGEELFRRRTSWACTSASAMRARREEQQRLVVVVFQIAVCILLAPLYLTDTPLDASEIRNASPTQCPLPAQSSSAFSAKMIAEYDFCGGASVVRRVPAETRPLRPLTLSTPPRCASAPRTGLHNSGMHTDSVAAAGLRVDRHGLYNGALWVRQASREPGVDGRAGRRSTRGEATARHLFHAFGISLSDPSTASSPAHTRAELRAGRSCPPHAATSSREDGVWSPEEMAAEGVLTEVVVRPGHFTVLFATPPPTGAIAFPARQPPRTVAYRHPWAPFPDGHAAFSMILVRDGGPHPAYGDGGRCRTTPCSALRSTRCRVLEPTHWAYDIVATNARRRHGAHPLSGGSISAAAAVPVFVFVKTAYVPPCISEARRRPRHGDSAQQTFTQLYGEALQRLTGVWRGCESDGGPLENHKSVLPAQTIPPHATMPNYQRPSLTPRRVRVPQEAAEVQLRVRYLSQQVLEAAAVCGTQSYVPALPPKMHSCLTASSADVAGRTGTLHRVQLSPASLLWSSATGRGVNSSAAAPRRTPVTLNPNLQRATREEKEAQAALHARSRLETALTHRQLPGTAHSPLPAQASNTEEGLARMRPLLDTGRGSVLRRLPRACAAPCPWMPERGVGRAVENNGVDTAEGATTAISANDTPPITTIFSEGVSVTQWARKFLIIASPTTPQRASSPTCEPAAVLPPGLACPPKPHALQWWVVDQHAVHERVRLEFFLCFADIYVCHPELQHGMGNAASEGALAGSDAASDSAPHTSLSLSPHARMALARRRRVAQLLCSLAVMSPASSPYATMASSSFPVSLPGDWRLRVTAMETHLRQWGWRFHHESAAGVHRGETRSAAARSSGMRVDQSTHSRTRPSLATAVAAWPCLEVEGVVCHVTSTQALQQTVEELEAVGAAATAESDSAFTPLQTASADPVLSCCRFPGPSQVPRSSSPCSLLVPSVFLDFFISRSCRGAIMFGDLLRPTSARSMVAALDCVEQYYVCSHGRPSFTHLTPAQ